MLRIVLVAALLAGPAQADPREGPEGAGIRARIRAHIPWVRCLAWSPDGQRLASGGNDGAIRLWDLSAPTALAEVEVARTGHGDP